MSNIDEIYDLCTLRDNLKNANSEIQEDEVRKEYSLALEELIEQIQFRIDDLENTVRQEKRAEDRQQEREYREMVGM